MAWNRRDPAGWPQCGPILWIRSGRADCSLPRSYVKPEVSLGLILAPPAPDCLFDGAYDLSGPVGPETDAEARDVVVSYSFKKGLFTYLQ